MEVSLTRPLPNPRLLPIQLDLLRTNVRVAFDDLLDLLPEELAPSGRVLFLKNEVPEVRRGDVGGGGEDGIDVVESFLPESGSLAGLDVLGKDDAHLIAKMLQCRLNELAYSLAFDLMIPELRTKPENRENGGDKSCPTKSASVHKTRGGRRT